MKKSFKSFLEDIMKLPYKPNPQDNPQHENQIKELLIKHKIKFIEQPNGSQSFPDFYLPDQDLNLECKSVKAYKPMWNRGLPRPDALYIISSKKLDRNSIFFGKQILPEEERLDLIKNDLEIKAFGIKKAKEHQKKYNTPWTIYPRLAYDNNLDYCTLSYKDIYFDKNHVKKVFEQLNIV